MDRSALIDLMIYSLDHELSDQEKAVLKKALKEHQWLREERAQLLAMRQQLRGMKAQFGVFPSFTASVLGQIDQPNIEKGGPTILAKWFPKIAAACLLIVTVSLVNLYLSSEVFSVDAIIGLEDLDPDEAFTYLNSQSTD